HVAQRPPVSRLTPNVVDENRAAFLHRGADHSFTERQPQRGPHLFGITDRICDSQILPASVEQIDRKGAETRQACDELWNLCEQLLEVDHGGHLAPPLEELREQFCVSSAAANGLEARVRRCILWFGHRRSGLAEQPRRAIELYWP